MKEALRLEKEAYARMRQELDQLKRIFAVEAGVHHNVGPGMDRLFPIVPSTGNVVVETTDSAEGIGGVVGCPGNWCQGRELVLQLLSLLYNTFRGGDVEDSDSPIGKRVRNEPQVRHSSISQSSMCINSTPGVGKGKCAYTNVYMSRKRTKAMRV